MTGMHVRGLQFVLFMTKYRMKRKYRYIALATALLALAGCNREPLPGVGEISVDATLGAMTKTTGDGVHTQFVAGDRIAVYAWTGDPASMPASRVVDGVMNSFDGTAWTPASPMLWKNAHDAHFFLGVSPVPATPIADFTAAPYTTTGSAAADDLLFATNFGPGNAGLKASDGTVSLGFQHAMARLSVNLLLRGDWTTPPAAETVQVSVEARNGATVNFLAQTVAVSGSVASISLPAAATVPAGYSLSYSGILVPQTGVRKITVNLDGLDYVCEQTADIPLASGKHTTLSLTVGRNRVEINDVSVNAWTNGADLPGGEVLPDMVAAPLTVEAIEAGATVTFSKGAFSPAVNPVYYRVFHGNTWSAWKVYNAPVTLPNVGDKVEFRATNASYSSNVTYPDSYCTFNFDKDCYVYGNIMSLVDKDEYKTGTPAMGERAFSGLFKGNSHLKSHPTKRLLLPAKTLTVRCYEQMFYNCTGLTVAPELPATTLTLYCYRAMFRGCSQLTVAPALPATTLAEGCYSDMFSWCKQLTQAPELPATELAAYCYEHMFSECTMLSCAPELPAMTLAVDCYHGMFNECSSISSAPDLPATTLANGCYRSMFISCTRLSSVTCKATDISAYNCLYDWLADAGTADGCERKLYVDASMLGVGTANADGQWRLADSGTEGSRWMLVDSHDSVEMGDGLKWATCNVGASRPEHFGSYFAWGETAPKATYTFGNYAWTYLYNPATEEVVFSQYTGSDISVLLPADDAARQQWHGDWRMPTKEEWQGLMDTTQFDWTWTSDYNGTGVAGVTVTSKVSGYEGNSIFLPAAGNRWNVSEYGVGTHAVYMSSTLDVDDPAFYFAVDYDGGTQQVLCLSLMRDYGRTVRPVKN